MAEAKRTRQRDGAASLGPASGGETHHTVRANDGTRLYVRSRGGHANAKLRVFLCDGIACDGFIWKYLWNDVAAAAPVTHFHYRGHGRSAPPRDPERIGIEAHADDLRAVRQSVGDPPCVLVGHSMGTQVVLEAYRRAPTNVYGLVLLCGSFGRMTRTFHGMPLLDQWLPKLVDWALRAPALVRALWGRVPGDAALRVALRAGELDPERIRPADLVPYFQHVAAFDPVLFLQMARAAGEHSAWDLLGRVPVPVLVVAGERDTFTPPFLAQAMVNALPRGELLLLLRGSHVAPLEQHELADERIVAFVRARAREAAQESGRGRPERLRLGRD